MLFFGVCLYFIKLFAGNGFFQTTLFTFIFSTTFEHDLTTILRLNMAAHRQTSPHRGSTRFCPNFDP